MAFHTIENGIRARTLGTYYMTSFPVFFVHISTKKKSFIFSTRKIATCFPTIDLQINIWQFPGTRKFPHSMPQRTRPSLPVTDHATEHVKSHIFYEFSLLALLIKTVKRKKGGWKDMDHIYGPLTKSLISIWWLCVRARSSKVTWLKFKSRFSYLSGQKLDRFTRTQKYSLTPFRRPKSGKIENW